MKQKITIPENVKQEILAIEPETLHSHGVIKLAGDNKSFVCPVCGNGEGEDGTGITPKFIDSIWKWHCFKCGDSFNNISILALYYNLDSRSDFVEICRRACDAFGISLPIPESKKNKTPKTISEASLVQEDIIAAQKHIEDLPEDKRRGISLDTFKKFGCGYLADWIAPKARLAGFKPTPTPRIIAPAGKGYLARLTVPLETFADASDKDYIKEKPHAGNKEPFGLNFITEDTKFLIITEGEFDAMSIAQAVDNSAITPIGIGGAAEKKFIDFLDRKIIGDEKLKSIIIFDNDDTGKKSADKLCKIMIERGYPAVVAFLSEGDEKVDANDILQHQDGNFELADLVLGIINEHGDELDEIADDIEKSKKLKSNQMLFTSEQYKYIFRTLSDNSDLCNARRLSYLWHNEIRYLADTDKWANYDTDKGIWVVNPNSKNTALNPIVRKTADALSINTKTNFDEKIVSAFRNQRKYSPAITTLKGDELITITTKDLDTHKNLLNCENCVVDLQTGKVYPHSPDLHLSQMVKAVYRAGYHNDIVEKFLQDIQPDESTRAALLRFLGYAITGECCEEKFLFIDGSGGNGKGTLTGTILNIIDNYGCSFPIEGILLNKKIDANAATPAFNMLVGKRVAMSEEIPANVQLNSAKIKLLSGGDRIPIRLLHQEFGVIDNPMFTLILSGNNLPEIGDVHDPGIHRRLVRIPFNQSFRDNPNLQLKKMLLSPDCRSGMLSVLIENAIQWYENGLLISSEMKDAAEHYFESQDFIADFISEFCIRGRNLSIPRKQFLKCLQENYPKETRGLSDQTLTRMIEKVDGIIYARKENGYSFCGIGWNDAPEQGNFGDDFCPPPDI